MSKKEYNLNQEDVCIWFKSHLEGHSRIELMCSLIDICLPLELRFLGTYLEYAAGKHHAHLQKWERDANNPASFLITDLSDAKIRRRICLFMTLLHSHNKTIATKLFDVLSFYDNLASFVQVSSPTSLPNNSTKNEKTDPVVEPEKVRPATENTLPQCDSTSCNEFKLLLTLSSFHPAFSFNQRQIIREKLDQFVTLTDQDGNRNVKLPCLEKREADKETVNNLDSTVSCEQPSTTPSPDVTVSESSSTVTTSVNTQSIPGNVQRQGLLPTPLLQIRELHYPQYIPANFSPHQGQPILIPTSLTVLNQHDGMMVQTVPTINSNPQYTQNIPFHKLNTMVNKNNSLDNVQSHTLSSQQDVTQNTQFSSFHHTTSKRGSDTNERDATLKQPVLIQNPVPFQVISNSFPNTELHPVGDNTNWGNTSMTDKSHNPLSSQQNRTERNTLGSVSDLRAISSDANVQSSQRSYSESDICETTSVPQVCVPTRPAVSDTTTIISPNIIHCNTNNVNEYAMLYKSKLIGLPYTRGDGNILANNQLRPVLVAKNLTELNNIRNMHPNMPQLLTPLNLHNMNQMNKKNSLSNMSSSITSDVLTVSYSNRDSIVSSMPKIHSPQVFRSTDKPTVPTGINGGYLQQPNHDSYHSNASMENHPRQPSNQNQQFTEKNISKISPITIQVNRKKNCNINKHILSPGGSGQLSGDCVESSPAISPAHSPRRSPYSSPSTSPMSHRKDHTNSKHIDAYASATNWLKSLRLHKYSHKFEGYSFQMMKDLTEESLTELISTKGAQTKFKQNIEHLVKQGFVEFSSPDNPSINEDTCISLCNHVTSPSETSPSNKQNTVTVSNTVTLSNNVTSLSNNVSLSNTVTLSNDVQSFLLTPVLDTHSTHDYRTVNSYYNNEVNELHKGGKARAGSPVIRPVGYFEDMTGRIISEPCIDEDTYEEASTSRKQSTNLATCYNCGAKGHYGHQCIEETMEAQTYSRYAFQLDFSRRESITSTEGKTETGSITTR